MTNDVRALREGGDAAYCATLTPKGKIFADAFVRLAGSESDEFLLDVDREKSSEFLRALRMLSLRKRVTIEDANEHRVVVASADADVGDSSARAVRRDERLEQLGFRGIVPASDAAWRDVDLRGAATPAAVRVRASTITGRIFISGSSRGRMVPYVPLASLRRPTFAVA